MTSSDRRPNAWMIAWIVLSATAFAAAIVLGSSPLALVGSLAMLAALLSVGQLPRLSD